MVVVVVVEVVVLVVVVVIIVDVIVVIVVIVVAVKGKPLFPWRHPRCPELRCSSRSLGLQSWTFFICRNDWHKICNKAINKPISNQKNKTDMNGI